MKHLTRIKVLGIALLLSLIGLAVSFLYASDIPSKIESKGPFGDIIMEMTYKGIVKLGLIEERGHFYTSPEHREKLGIEIIELPVEEEKELHSMIEQTIRAGFLYYETKDEKEFKKVKNLFVPEEYERLIENIRGIHIQEENEPNPFPCKTIPNFVEKKFSQPRKYKSGYSENRIGIISLFGYAPVPANQPVPRVADFFQNGGCRANQFHIFIFKRTQEDKKWRIEGVKSVVGVNLAGGVIFEWLELEEAALLLYLTYIK